MHKLTLSFKGNILRVYHLAGKKTLIGRSPECDIQIDNLAVSQTHARVELNDHKATIIDMSDDNSLFVNNQKVSECELNRGDEILIGKHTLSYSREMDPVRDTDQTHQTVKGIKNGWLQFMSGPKLGRTMKLEESMLRLGKPGEHEAIIACRRDGYYLSHLNGDSTTRIGNEIVGEESVQLNDGDTIQVGDIKMLFFTDK